MSLTPSRRRLLQAALLTPVVVACTPEDRDGPVRVDPDVALRRAAIARERELVERYRAAAASSSSAVAALVAPMIAEHEQHLTALGAPSPAPTGALAVGGAPPLAVLAAAERSAAAAHAAGALAASRQLAVVLASLAASEASHAVLFA